MQTRTLRLSDFGVRAATPDTPAAITGIAVPYGVDINYAGQVERFAADSIDAAAAVGVPLLYGHNYTDPDAWMGSITGAENTPGGLRVEAEVLDPSVARKLRASSALLGLSVGVEIGAATHEDDQSVTYTAAALHELSITPVPAYGADSTITEVRHQEEAMPDAPAAREVPDLGPLTTRLDQIEARMTAPPPAPAPVVSVRDAFAAGIRDYCSTRQVRALADVVSAGNAGVLPPVWSTEVIGWLDSRRYLMSQVGTYPFPATGETITFPKITQRTLVAARGAQKTEIPSRALQTGTDAYTAQWFAGGNDVALELISQSSPDAFQLVAADLLDQYALATEEAFVADAETGAGATEPPLDFTDFKAFIAGAIPVSAAIREATGVPGLRLALTTDSWVALLGLTDFIGRRILSSVNPGNTDGSAQLIDESVNVGGIVAFHSPMSTVDLMFNDKALRVAEKPPMQLTVDSVALMGRDIGVLGATIALPLYPGGVVKFTA